MIQTQAWQQKPLPRTLRLGAIVGSLLGAIGVVAAGPIALLVPVGAAVAAMTAFMPGVLFAIYIISGVYKAAIQPYSPVDITLVLAILNELQIIPLIFDRQPRNISRIGLSLFLAVGVLYLAGVLYAPDQTIALSYVSTFWILSLLPMIPAAIRIGSKPAYLRQFLWALFACGIPMTIFGLFGLNDTARLAAFGASTIEVSRTALLIPLIWVVFILRQRGLLIRAVTVALIPAAVVVAIASGSRGPLLALAALGAFGGLRYLAQPGRISWKTAGTIAGAVLATVITLSVVSQALPSLSLVRFTLFEDFIGQIVNGDLNTSTGDTSSGRRVVLFEAAFSMFEERPILGYGTGGYESASPPFTGPPFYAYPHDALLQFMAEFGLVGAALFSGLSWVALTRRFPRDHLGNPIKVAFAFFLLNAMVSDDIYSSRPLWGLFVLVLLINVPKAEVAAKALLNRDWAVGSRAALPVPGSASVTTRA